MPFLIIHKNHESANTAFKSITKTSNKAFYVTAHPQA